jgi:ribulose-phosphate 3-epimerase
MKIVPAILCDQFSLLKEMVRVSSQFCDFLHIDITDGRFVPSKSITAEDLAKAEPSVGMEAHIMVKEPEDHIDSFKSAGVERIVFHFEATDSPEYVIDEIRERDLAVGLAINPDTELDRVESLLDRIDMLLLLSVYPGFYGARFVPSVLDKAYEAKRRRHDLFLGMDGGIKVDNIRRIKDAQVDLVAVGSAILKAEDPKEAFYNLRRAVE